MAVIGGTLALPPCSHPLPVALPPQPNIGFHECFFVYKVQAVVNDTVRCSTCPRAYSTCGDCGLVCPDLIPRCMFATAGGFVDFNGLHFQQIFREAKHGDSTQFMFGIPLPLRV